MLHRLLSMRRMAEDLRARKIGRGEFWCYAGLFVVLVAYNLSLLLGITSLNIGIPYEPAYLEDVELYLGTTFSLAVLLLGYWINTRGDGLDFWYRYLSINIPILITIVLVSILAGVVAVLTGISSVDVIKPSDIVLEGALYALYAYSTYKYMRILSTPA